MGDRGVVVFKCKHEVSCGVYVHWNGEGLPRHLTHAQPTMRRGDVGYAAARFAAHMCNLHPDEKTGVGLLPPPDDVSPATLKAYSHGDAGVLLVDVDTGVITAHAGYLEKEQTPTLHLLEA